MSEHEYKPMSFETLYTMYRGSVLRFLVRRCGAYHDAEDLTQQIFEYILRVYDSYDPSKASLKSWIFMITLSRWKNYCRDRKVFCDVDSIIDLTNDEDDLGKAIWLDELRKNLNIGIRQLSQVQQKIVIMRYFENMNNRQIAQMLGLTEINVRVSLSRALDKLNKKLSDIKE